MDLLLVSFWGDTLDRTGIPPDLAVSYTHFAARTTQGFPDGPVATVKLAEIEACVPTTPLLDPNAFVVALDIHREDIMRTVTTTVLIEAANILRAGVTRNVRQADGSWKPQQIRGVVPALDHLQQGIASLQYTLRRGASEGTFQDAMRQLQLDYAKAAATAAGAGFRGVFTGIHAIDTVHKGLRRGELALVLAFVSHLKTTWCLNWFYKAAVYQKKACALVPLESPVDVVQKQLVCLHTTHPKFAHLQQGEYEITYDRLRDGLLTPTERVAFEEVAEDLRTCRDYGPMFYKSPQDKMTVDDIRVWLRQETQRRGDPLDFLVIDYLGLLDPDKTGAGLAQFSNLNRAIRLTKLLALEYADGLGIAVASPFQANREGLKEAEKTGGEYTLRALAGANEAERSADYVYSLYWDTSMRTIHQLAVGNLKARNAPLLTEMFRVFVDPFSRTITNLDLAAPAQQPVQGGIP